MNFENGNNYTVLSNNINQKFLGKFNEYPIINDNLDYEQLQKKLEFHTSKMIVFNNSFYNLKYNEILNIVALLKKQNMNFINITSDVEESLFTYNIIFFDEDNLVLHGKKEDVLKEEKNLKRIGFGLPFVVDLSLQLNYYDVLNQVYYDLDSLVGALWN